ncbi:MAG: HAD-IC family P-type ATPase [Ruminococcus sp.]|nr:HAD-IC family P-type ATPase [Ruminococcus sp.]
MNTDRNIERYSPTIQEGLSTLQVEKRLKQGLINKQNFVKTKSIGSIVLENSLTLFNLINFALALALMWAGSYKNMLFMAVVLFNLIIGIVQEVRAKITADRLSLISAIKTTVVRNGVEQSIPIDGIVLDDILRLKVGNQVVADCTILDGFCEVNESFITGEANPISKKQGDTILSGSYIVSGGVYAQAEKIADSTYISNISKEAKKLTKHKSEIMEAVNKIIKVISVAIFPIGAFLLYRQYQLLGDIKMAVVQTTAGLIGMIPEGLVLLTSMVFAVSVIRLAKHNVLVQDLPSVESLARVDTLCLDKTGTLTTGDMLVEKVICTHKDFNTQILSNILLSIVDNENSLNATSKAIKEYSESISKGMIYKVTNYIPFSSLRKWSCTELHGLGTFAMGAYESIFPNGKLQSKVDSYSSEYRVVTLAYTSSRCVNGSLPLNLEPIALILLKDTLRPNIKETLDYFKSQDVSLKIISGDSVKTVSTIAKSIGLSDTRTLDTSKISDNQLKKVVENYSLFCRVTPEKKCLIVKSLKNKGHVVAMTGDGVNDVPALKESDCSIAISSGAEATRNVSQFILLNSEFSSLPKILAEGRRSMNNIKRSASLFLIKTTYSILLDLVFIILALQYPFVPIQLTLISGICIGIPSFILALEPNNHRVKGSFLKHVLSRAIPTAIDIVIIFTTLSILGSKVFTTVTSEEISTICVISTGFIGLLHLFRICKPLNPMRATLLLMLCLLFIGGLTICHGLFSIVAISKTGFIMLAVAMVISFILFSILHSIRNIAQNRLT